MQFRDIRILLVLLFAAAAFLQPIHAQEGDDDGIEIEEGAGEGGDTIDPEEEERIRKKNSGLAGGGGPNPNDDKHAPKVKLSLQQQINKALKNGVAWLKSRQDKEGSWGPVRATRKYGEKEASGNYTRDELGPTAWAIYTLSKCGVPKNDPVIRKGLKFLESQTGNVFDEVGGKPKDDPSIQVLTPYESAALVLMAEAVYQRSEKLTKRHKVRKWKTKMLEQRPKGSMMPKRVWIAMHKRIDHLLYGRLIRNKKGGKMPTIKGTHNVTGNNRGGWRYGQANGDADLSTTQFVLLALRAASQAGYPLERRMFLPDKVVSGGRGSGSSFQRNPVPDGKTVWERTAGYVMNCQNSDGGFRYQIQPSKSTGSMTACGVASLVICKEQIELVNRARKKQKSEDPQLTMPEGIDEAIERGKEWLDKNFVVGENPGAGHHYYYLYGVERVGDLTGRKEFAGKDWYVRGARLLIPKQAANGAWTDATAYPPRDVLGTCFALLFLKRATPPVVTSTER